jgi:diguanylate cyclase (GGDEF)-like protein
VHEEDRHLVANAMREAFADGVVLDLDHRIRHPDGTLRFVHFQGEVLIDDAGQFQRMLGTVQDVTDQRSSEAKIYFLGNYDSVTHLPNRNLFLHRLTQAIAGGLGTTVNGVVFVLNLDRYYRISDVQGTRNGDQLLKDVATRLQHTLTTGSHSSLPGSHESTVLARISEDQFAVLLPGLPTPGDSARVAQSVLASFQAPFQISATSMTLTANIGLTIPGADGTDATMLLRNAGIALQAAAEKGRNTYQYYSDSMNAAMDFRMCLEQDLRTALTDDQFLLYYQPKVDVLTEEIVGAEALIRWQHPSRGLISPAEFISVAEEEDLIIPLSEWVLRKAAQQQKAWRNSGVPPFPISINLSSLHFKQRNLAYQIKAIVLEHGGDPRYLELELTEGVLMRDAATTVGTLNQLKESGFRLAIDDFGTGYSSLAYLQKFPIDTLKIDRTFLKELKLGKTDSPIVRAIIGMGQALKLHLLAEGVETQDQLRFLRMQGCHTYQGYLCSKPAPPDQFLQLIQHRLRRPPAKSA